MRFLRWVPFCALLGCAGGNAASQLVRPPEFQPANQTKCAVRKSASHPLVVEWPSADRATLEAKARSGLVAVRYVGCEMEVLDRCKVTGKYGYTAITPKQERVTIHDADELYASLPVGAARLEGTLAQSGQLDVDMTIVGQWDADHTDLGSADLQGDDCARATHVISAMTVGAFEFYSGGDANVGAQAGAFGVGARGKSAASRELLERDGSPAQCQATRGDETAPPEDCGAVLRVEVTPIHASPPAAAPAPAPAESATTTATNPPPTMTMLGGLTSSTMFRSSNDGNLDVTVRCESTDVLTPYAGLAVYVDGASAPIAAKRVHLAGPQDLTQAAPTGPIVPMGMPSDVAYALDPGHHMLRVTAPGCSALETAVDVSDGHPTTVDGYLPADTAWGKGTSGTPLGGTFAIGAYIAPFPHASASSNSSYDVTANVNGSSGPYGAWFGIGGTSRWWLGMLDMGIGFGSIQGQVSSGDSAPGDHQAEFTGSTMHMSADLRFGGRLPLRWAALSAGSGIGGAFYIVTSTHVADSNFMAGSIPDLGAPVWFVPLWAGLDVKPWCDWGVSTGASYDWAPTQPGWSSMTFWVGVLDQPSGGACGHDASLQVH